LALPTVSQAAILIRILGANSLNNASA